MADTEAKHAALPPSRRLGMGTTLAYGFGTIAYGVKDFAFLTFLLLFYNQVLELPPERVGLVIMAALIVDAFVDPLIGSLSDRTRSRWGRRHPWMYASVIPIVVSWLFLWNPPDWSDDGLLLWLFVTAVALRTAVSCYEVPSQALTPELTASYDERTRLVAYRYLFGWAGGMGMMIVTFAFILVPGPGQEAGQLSRGGYPLFSVVSAVAMAAAILISAIGTHHEIPRLPRPEIVRRSLGEGLREFFETISNRAFLTVLAAGFCYYSAQGISFSLSQYLYAHVWLFSETDYLVVPLVLLGGAVLAWLIAPRVAKRTGKPMAAMLFMAGAAMLLTAPYILRLVGLFPPIGSPWMIPLLFAIFGINGICSVSATMLGASMMADVVEHSEAKTGRRSEGAFYAGSFFIQKCCSGIGIFAAAQLLGLISFPTGARPGSVAEPVIDSLMLLFVALYLGFGLIAAVLYGRFPFGKAEHEARVKALAEAGD